MKLPDSWVVVPIASVCEINPKIKTEEKPNDDTIVSFVPMSAVDENNATIAQPELRKYLEVSKGYTYFKSGDVLFAKVTPCMENGKAAIARELENGLGFGSTEFHVLRPSEMILPEYLLFYIRQSLFRVYAKSSFVGTGGLQRVPPVFFARAKIPLPTLSEQRRITKILQLIEKIKGFKKKQVYSLYSLIDALFFESFGAPELNSYGGEFVRLSTAAEINPPFSAPVDDGVQVSFVPMSDVDDISGLMRSKQSAAFNDVKTGYTKFIENDVLFAKISPCMENGKIAVAKNLINGIGVGSTEFHVLRAKENSVPEFIWALLRRPVFRTIAKRAFIGTSGHQRVAERFLRNYKLGIPSKVAQHRFADKVRLILEEVAMIEISILSLEESAQLIFHSAFTGSLTETWRPKNEMFINKEFNSRNAKLKFTKKRLFKTTIKIVTETSPISLKILDKKTQPTRNALLKDLSNFQRSVRNALQKLNRILIPDDSASLDHFCNELSPENESNLQDRVLRALDQLACLGLIAKVSLPNDQGSYLNGFRMLREGECHRLEDIQAVNAAIKHLEEHKAAG